MELVDRLEAIAGRTSSATLSLFGLMEGNGWTTRAIVRGSRLLPRSDSEVELNLVGPGFFDTVGMPLVAGRSFAAPDYPDEFAGQASW